MDIRDETYVSLTTFRASGEPVATPVWIVDLGKGQAGVVTDADSGKVRRLQHDERVMLTPCDVRGRVEPGAPTLSGTARVVTDGPEMEAINAGIRSKHGVLARLLGLARAVRGRFGEVGDRVGLVIALGG